MVAINYTAFDCPDFKNKGTAYAMHAVVGPFRTVEEVVAGKTNTLVFSSCSLYWECENALCSYSEASQELKRKRKAEEAKGVKE